MLRFVTSFLLEPGPYPKLAEESSGRNGYSHPFRAGRDGEAIRLDIRLRDFDVAGLEARKAEVLTLGERAGATHVATVDQYVNMGPRMQDRLDLVDRAVGAARRVGVEPVLQPIRGGTGVDPFLDRGTAIANLGTGYFAPESEKELTSLQWMALHARWLVELVRDFAVA
jgi:tripeptide aminopeptidase